MSRRYSYHSGYSSGYYHSTTAAEVSSLARQSIQKAARKGITYHPVVPTTGGRNICKSWWGLSWCKNLERYSDYSNRLGRGKKYINAGAVLDLQISSGLVIAVVQGSSSNPYNVRIRIDPLPDARKKELTDACARRVKNMEDLINGKFPEELKGLFFQQNGLFPAPREIHFSCSCPDSASMCKHVAAAMYAIGVKLDEDPSCFFLLRGIDAESFITKALEDKVEGMLKNAKKKSKRIISSKSDIESLFGVL